jgi:hypothetical protein
MRPQSREARLRQGRSPVRPSCPHVRGCQVDREPGPDGRSDQPAVFDDDRIVAELGLWVRAMTFLPVLAVMSSSRSLPSISAPYPGRSPACACATVDRAGAPRPWRRTPTRSRLQGRGRRDPNAGRGRRFRRSSHSRRARSLSSMTPARQYMQAWDLSSRSARLSQTVRLFYFSIEAGSASTGSPRYTAAAPMRMRSARSARSSLVQVFTQPR